MKVLVVLLNNVSEPYLEIGLDLIRKHKKLKDDVSILTCRGGVDFCIHKASGGAGKCILCKECFRQGIKRIGVSEKDAIYLNPSYVGSFNINLPKKFKNFEELRSFCIGGIGFGRGVASSLISYLMEHDCDVVKHSKLINRMLRTSCIMYNNVYSVLEKLKPDLCYVCNGRSVSTYPVVQACKKLGIDFSLYEKAASINSYLVVKNNLLHDLSNIKQLINDCWENSHDSDAFKKAKGREWFENKVKKKGAWFYFTDGQVRDSLPQGFDVRKKNVVFFNSSLDELELFPEWKNSIYRSEKEAMVKILQEFCKNEELFFYFRVHPRLSGLNNTQIRELKDLSNMRFDNLKIIWPEERIDSYALMRSCDKIVTFGSTMGVESAFWSKPSVLIGHAGYEDLGCCYQPTSHKDVKKMIESDLKPKDIERAIIYGYWQASSGIPLARSKFHDEKKYFSKIIIPNLKLKDWLVVKAIEYGRDVKTSPLKLRFLLGRIKRKIYKTVKSNL